MIKARFLSQNHLERRNNIETKPIQSTGRGKRENPSLGTTKQINKIVTDILGNEYICRKELFSFKCK